LCDAAVKKAEGQRAMSGLVGAVTVASAIAGVMLGQVTAGMEFFGVILAGLTLMTVRA
jgi:hypothetical protein